MRKGVASIAAAVALLWTSVALAEPVSRASPAAGSVIARKTGEEVRFIDVSSWRGVDIHQDLLAGDELRTNALGSLAVLFSDNTQVRLGRNTTMVVKSIGVAADSHLALQSGTIWARAERGGDGVVVETPAAAAAIRGTDWTMSVDADGRTSLIVLEGLVELSNEFGSVTVARGEAASASIGSAPTKTIIVDPADREQMLFYLSLRSSFGAMPASPLSSPDMRRERARVGAIPDSARSGEDWLSLAEVSLSYDGREAARKAVDQARRSKLSAAQRARLDLIDGLMAASAGRYAEANALFERARPRLSGSRRAMAAYGGYFARSLANPDHVERPPAGADGGPYGAMIEAWTAGFLKDIPAAIEVIRRAEQRFPNDPTLPAVRAQFALLVDDREQVKEGVERALALDPEDPTALEARANYRAGIEGDLSGALDDLTRASQIAPGSTSIWNALGLVLSARGASREAEAALKRAIELDPEDPVSRANLAIMYLEQDRLKAAKVEIDKAIASDPAFDIGLTARGLYHLKTGEMDKAMEDLLAGSTANPAYSQGLLLLAAGYYESGDYEPAEQALENADRLDPNDPATASFATAIAINDYDSDRAIRSAQEALKRSRARGGDYASVSASRDQGSTLNEAYRLQGLDAWGRYYGDVVFDPFSASALVDQSVAGSPSSFMLDGTFGNQMGEPVSTNQSYGPFLMGLMLDPQMLAGRDRSANLLRRPFLEGSIEGGAIGGAADGWTGEGIVKGYMAYPFPISFYGQVNASDSEQTRTPRPNALFSSSSFDLKDDSTAGTGYLTASPTPNDRIVAYFNLQDVNGELLNAETTLTQSIPFDYLPGTDLLGTGYSRQVEDKTGNYGLAWSHTLGYRNIVNAGIFASGFNRDSVEAGGFVLTDGIDVGVLGFGEVINTDQTSYLAALNHTYGTGDLTLRYGVEGGTLDQSRSELFVFAPGTILENVTTDGYDVGLNVGRAYADAVYEFTPTLKAEAGVFTTYIQGSGFDELDFEPRLGLAWTPAEGHWLRAGYMREGWPINAVSFAPVGIVGLQSNQMPLDIGGYTDTFAARWEAQWTDHVFTSIDYQHQQGHDLSIPVPLSLQEVSLSDGRIDRVSATVNVWLTHGFGAFGTFAYADSENRDPASIGFGGPLPFVPETLGRIGVTWVNDHNIKATLAATYVGNRVDDTSVPLDSYWTADAFLTWEPFDKRFELEIAAYNLFDEYFEVDAGIPGWGRTFTGSLKIRF
ncbi:tetratricopeptide repeat protein [Arvimicrobium flavum]|uniref:tetratricopeptide repeat protein n=1 Tax=Arvimicrobium flavum TaxID=3393320 RepID=UPI00237BE2E3|nr:tetratricopeptide repeat protein [Mesorhizobium shangrilense]